MPKARAIAIEISVVWGDVVLQVIELDPPRPFTLGLDPKSCDVVVPQTAIEGTRREVIAAQADGSLAIVAHDGLVPVELGTAMSLVFGSIELRIACEAPLARAPRKLVDKRRAALLGASAVLHASLLVAAACAPAPIVTEDDVAAEQAMMIQQALARADEHEMEELRATEEVAENTADQKEGGSGARARAEEGSMGNPSAPITSPRYGVAGPQDNVDPHIARQESLREAAEFGMIGLMNSGAGGDPTAPSAPWGRDDSLGNNPLTARGNMWGDSIGESFGMGGVGLTGIGEGGGGRGEGLGKGIGLGNVGTVGHGAPAATQVAPKPVIAAPAPVPVPVEERIDPNGRFASTYRPGGGHLAAFESAIARGVVPDSARELVSDLGARYSPDLAAPTDKALAIRADLERSALAPTGGPVHLRVALRSANEAPKRPHLSVHLVLDVSGSMEGESINRARAAAAALVDKLDGNDDFSMTTFSSNAQVIVQDEPLAGHKEAIKQVISTVHADGGTNIWEGLRAGYEQAEHAKAGDDAIKVVLLLSDGRANGGITKTESLSRLALEAFQKGIQTSSFGLGSDYDGELMSSIARDGAGGYYYLARPDQIAPALTTEIDKRLDPVATGVELRVRLKRGVELYKAYGSRRLNEGEASTVRAMEVAVDNQAKKRDHIATDREDDAEGGMRFFFPAFAHADAHAALFQVALPPGVGEKDVATIELKYKDRLHGKNETLEQRVTLRYADSDAASAATIDASVARTIQGFAAGETLLRASTLIQKNQRESAAGILSEREGILRQASATLHEPLFLKDADRLARFRSQATGTAGSDDGALVLAMLLETAGSAHLR